MDSTFLDSGGLQSAGALHCDFKRRCETIGSVVRLSIRGGLSGRADLWLTQVVRTPTHTDHPTVLRRDV
jgi:hypothetical protein